MLSKRKKRIIQNTLERYDEFLDQLKHDMEELINDEVFDIHSFIDITSYDTLRSRLQHLAIRDFLFKLDQNNRKEKPEPNPLPICDTLQGKYPDICSHCVFYNPPSSSCVN